MASISARVSSRSRAREQQRKGETYADAINVDDDESASSTASAAAEEEEEEEEEGGLGARKGEVSDDSSGGFVTLRSIHPTHPEAASASDARLHPHHRRDLSREDGVVLEHVQHAPRHRETRGQAHDGQREEPVAGHGRSGQGHKAVSEDKGQHQGRSHVPNRSNKQSVEAVATSERPLQALAEEQRIPRTGVAGPSQWNAHHANLSEKNLQQWHAHQPHLSDDYLQQWRVRQPHLSDDYLQQWPNIEQLHRSRHGNPPLATSTSWVGHSVSQPAIPGNWPDTMEDDHEDTDDESEHSDVANSHFDGELGHAASIEGPAGDMDEGMLGMLAEMAAGTFRSHDALGQLYEGDRGFNVATLPLYPFTAELRQRGLRTPLHRHQLQGLLWMIQAEHRRHKPDKRAGLWHTRQISPGRNVYRNVANNKMRRDPPSLPRGGINADAMGLGKTLQVIALALSDPYRVPRGIPIRTVAPSQIQSAEDGHESDASLASSYCSVHESSDESISATNASLSQLSQSDTESSSDEEHPSRKIRKTSHSQHAINRNGKSHNCDMAPPSKVDIGPSGKITQREDAASGVRKPFNNSTLVICPLSVLQNWTQQVADHCSPGSVKFLSYHSASAKKLRSRPDHGRIFSRYHFVFTTYDTVRSEFTTIEKRRLWEHAAKLRQEKREEERQSRLGARKVSQNEQAQDELEDERFLFEDFELMPAELTAETPLFGVPWRRVILDEAHIVRNPGTTIYRAVCELKGERRWAITGTPIVNSTGDLGALAAWIGLDPFSPEDMQTWRKLIERPLRKPETAQRAAGLLRAVVHSLCLRRHKGMTDADGAPLVKLPWIRYYQHNIGLTASDRDFYEKCEKVCREIVERWLGRDELHQHQGVVLLFLLRLRQMSCHRQLIGPQLLEELQTTDWDAFDARAKATNGTIELSAAKIEDLRQRLRVLVEMGNDCPVCLEPLADRQPMITPCAHPFCRECITAIVINAQNTQRGPLCPMDRLPLPRDPNLLVELKSDELQTADFADWEFDDHTSAKVRECLRIVQGSLESDPREKILVFSNFVKFLDIIAEELEDLGYSFARFNGAMNVQRRNDVLVKFSEKIRDSQITAIRNAIARYKQRVEHAQRAAEANEMPGSGLLSALQRVDWKVSGPSQKAYNSKGKSRKASKVQRDVIGDNPSILLISMGCGALGLNLTAASTVVLMDPWWQSTIEQQAIDRVHRIGQKRDIKVFQMVCKNTVEERVLQIQKEKESLAEQAFSGIRTNNGTVSDRREKTLTSVRDLARLFGMDERRINALQGHSQDQHQRRYA